LILKIFIWEQVETVFHYNKLPQQADEVPEHFWRCELAISNKHAQAGARRNTGQLPGSALVPESLSPTTPGGHPAHCCHTRKHGLGHVGEIIQTCR
jgi:hypothetical protein